VDLEHADDLPLVGLQGPHHHRAGLLSGVRFIVRLHLGKDEEVDHPDHAGEHCAEEEERGSGMKKVRFCGTPRVRMR
jgi:hypothetical protein